MISLIKDPDLLKGKGDSEYTGINTYHIQKESTSIQNRDPDTNIQNVKTSLSINK